MINQKNTLFGLNIQTSNYTCIWFFIKLNACTFFHNRIFASGQGFERNDLWSRCSMENFLLNKISWANLCLDFLRIYNNKTDYLCKNEHVCSKKVRLTLLYILFVTNGKMLRFHVNFLWKVILLQAAGGLSHFLPWVSSIHYNGEGGEK